MLSEACFLQTPTRRDRVVFRPIKAVRLVRRLPAARVRGCRCGLGLLLVRAVLLVPESPLNQAPRDFNLQMPRALELPPAVRMLPVRPAVRPPMLPVLLRLKEYRNRERAKARLPTFSARLCHSRGVEYRHVPLVRRRTHRVRREEQFQILRALDPLLSVPPAQGKADQLRNDRLAFRRAGRGRRRLRPLSLRPARPQAIKRRWMISRLCRSKDFCIPEFIASKVLLIPGRIEFYGTGAPASFRATDL